MRISADDVEGCIVECVRNTTGAALDPHSLPDDFDLLAEGILDSLGFVQLLGALEARLGRDIDLSDMDPDHLGRPRALARYIAEKHS